LPAALDRAEQNALSGCRPEIRERQARIENIPPSPARPRHGKGS
jgi:hypothetical protein